MAARPTSAIIASPNPGFQSPDEGAVWLNGLNAFAAQLFGGLPITTLTAVSGSIAPIAAVHYVDTEGQTAADDIVSIDGANLSEGAAVLLLPAATGRALTFKHQTGNLSIASGGDLILDRDDQSVWAFRTATGFRLLGVDFGGDKAKARSALGLAATATMAEASEAEAQAGASSVKLTTVRRVYDMIKTAALMITGRTAQTVPADTDEILLARSGALYRMTRANFIASSPWSSGEIAVTANSGVVVVSGSGSFTGKPKSWSAAMVCKSSQGGYAVNEWLDLAAVTGLDISWRDGQLKWTRLNDWDAPNENGGSRFTPTASNWRLLVQAKG